MRPHRVRGLGLLMAATLIVLAACTSASGGVGPAVAPTPSKPVTLRLGFFPNVTHATALVGVQIGIFASKLGPNVKLQTKTFNAGPAAVEALFGDAVDATYVGPNPAINAFIRSKGKAIRIVSGATSGGAFLVVKPGISDAAQLKGTKVASPQLGGTQDVALRAWLKTKGLRADSDGGGDVHVVPQPNAQTLETFKSGAISAAWVPEPWASRLVTEGGGKVLIDERDLWPDGQYVTTQLVVATKFLARHPDVVEQLLEGQVATNDRINSDPVGARKATNDMIEKLTQKRLSDAIINAAWTHLTFTNDPIASSLTKSAADAKAVGLIDRSDLTGIYDLSILNKVLAAAGKPPVAAGI